MLNKKRLHHIWTSVRRIRPWYFLVIAVLCGGLSIYALRQNNLEMAKLRSAVYAADKNNGDVNGALQALQAYVTSHMNTDLSSGPNAPYPPIQLQYTYERLQEAEARRELTQSQANAGLYTQAENYCQQKIPIGFSGRYRVGCITQYVQSHGVSNFSIAPIPASLYEFDFLSPWWSPDLAGWSLVATVLAILAFIATWLTDRWFKQRLH